MIPIQNYKNFGIFKTDEFLWFFLIKTIVLKIEFTIKKFQFNSFSISYEALKLFLKESYNALFTRDLVNIIDNTSNE